MDKPIIMSLKTPLPQLFLANRVKASMAERLPGVDWQGNEGAMSGYERR